MAKSAVLKIPADIEYRAIGNAFGLMIATAGLLAGTMVQQRSFEYWPEDIVTILIVAWLLFRLFRNLLSTMTAYKDLPPRRLVRIHSEAPSMAHEHLVAGQIPAVTSPSPDQVVEAVARRLDEKRAKAEKSNKFTN
ncbi:MAG: hypothetical protein GJV46_00360 [Geobacter sp.]|nr:hypothetical protein [Geobacter sp.]